MSISGEGRSHSRARKRTGTRSARIEVFGVEQEPGGFEDTKISRHETVEAITVAPKRDVATLRDRQRTGRWNEPPDGPVSYFRSRTRQRRDARAACR
jgi:hypothetical protein